MRILKHTVNFIILFVLAAVWFSQAAANPLSGLVQAARSQIGSTQFYDSSYKTIDYPNGDVDIERGVCTDVVIRAMRKACSYDLQKQIHEDMQHHFSCYPDLWGLKKA